MKPDQMFDVRGKGCIVTGGANGIGLAFAEVMGENGARVTIIDRNEEALEATVSRLTSLGYDVRGVAIDITDKPAVHKAFDETTDFYGKLDVAFLNAGINSGPGFITRNISGAPRERPPERALENFDDARWEELIGMTLTSVFTTLKASARNMKRQNSGKIIVTTSVAAHVNIATGQVPYAVAKAGVLHLVKHAAIELAAYGIHVNAIAPGSTKTNSGNGFFNNPANAAAVENSKNMSLLRRQAEPSELAPVMLLLSSDASSYMTGSEVLVDGGFLLAPRLAM
ncbi:MAG: SDR family NAD(P)-dependent oxidoreductase [Phenylobacterium sp.]|uniref:SDR family NAD(P)-dependent oxidoreductase n=1 Tax=Phenylobacterium sp. TaxID=1871053 RepID=UPI002734F13A|nr:SDR family NAD(P)-dependent oxidoreductase [Phenylobacterium sp.]MDP3750020.1 SDR family NAD(P)-dependent oxidoreductase [Phenylobacterium sp.]